MTQDEALRSLLPHLSHEDENYAGDHWSTGDCPKCIVEVALGLRDPKVGGITLVVNQFLSRNRGADA